MGMEKKIAVKYKKATAPFDETARERLWATSPFDVEETSELAELVDSFYEGRGELDKVTGSGSGRKNNSREMLDSVLAESVADPVAGRVRFAVEDAVGVFGSGDEEWRMRVVCLLRERGYDAGLCRSQRDLTNGTSPSPVEHHHEYVDVMSNGSRYVVEVDVGGEFKIARPTEKYVGLVGAIPKVLVIKPEALKGLINIMCAAAKESIRSAGMHVPPWRTSEYMREKWLGSFERTATMTMMRMAVNGSGVKSAGVSRRKVCRLEISGRREDRDGKFVVAVTKGM